MPQESDLRDQARFVFMGTVQKLDATTLPQQAPATPKTAIVRVDQIIRGPDVFSDFAGRDITVQFPQGHSLKPREQRVFFTNSTVLADSLVVEALDYETPAPVAATLAAASTEDPAERLRHHDLRSRVASADVVVSGRVIQTRLAEDEPMVRAAAAAGPQPAATRISEHMPMWRDAVIEVESVHKGQNPGETAVVRYPASDDVRWHRAIKFSPGQEGFFLLHRGESKPKDRPRVAAAGLNAVTDVAPDVYTALHPLDYQPFDSSDAVQQIITDTKSETDK